MGKRIEIIEGDITTIDADAIVNAANSGLMPGGGVCGAIHRAAGPDLATACMKIGGCPTGQARITPGFNLKSRYVIHAVGPVWQGGNAGEDDELASAYRSSLELAAAHKLSSIAFPAISTGIYGFPADRAARIAVRTVRDYLASESTLQRVVLCCFGQSSTGLYRKALAALTAG